MSPADADEAMEEPAEGEDDQASTSEVDEAFSSLVSSMEPAMVVVTTAADGERSGCLVGFHVQCGIDPPRYAVWVSKANHTYGVLLRATHLAVHVLERSDREMAVRFGTETGDDTDKFEGLEVTDGPGGVPLLAACPNRFVLRRTVLVDDGGDHMLVGGEAVEATHTGLSDPLRLADVDDLTPGHDAEERRDPSTDPA